MTEPETPEQTYARLIKVPPEHRLRAQDRALDRAAAAIEKSRARSKLDSDVSSPPVSPPCPDPHAPDAALALYGAFYRRMWTLAHDGRATNMDVQSGFTAARIAAGVGKDLPPPDAPMLDMDSLLGGGLADSGDGAGLESLDDDAPEGEPPA